MWNIGETKNKPNRARPFSYSFRVSEKEKELLDNKVSQSGLCRTDYLIKVLTEKPIASIKRGDEILNELKRQGNNLNQAVKNLYYSHETERELLSVAADCKRLYRTLIAAIGAS